MQKMSTTFAEFTANVEHRKLLEREGLAFEATELISNLMQQHGVSKKELAERLGRSRAFVTQILSGSRNLTLHTLADALFALGYRAQLDFLPLADAKDDDGLVVAYEFPQPKIALKAKKWEKTAYSRDQHITPDSVKRGDDNCAA